MPSQKELDFIEWRQSKPKGKRLEDDDLEEYCRRWEELKAEWDSEPPRSDPMALSVKEIEQIEKDINRFAAEEAYWEEERRKGDALGELLKKINLPIYTSEMFEYYEIYGQFPEFVYRR